jgi:hypothetical protein
MKSGLENVLFLKKKVFNEYIKSTKLFFLFINFFFFPCILAIEGIIVFKLIISIEKYNIEESPILFILYVWIFSLFIVATSSMMLSIKKVYYQKIIELIITRTFLRHDNETSQYINQIRFIVGDDLKITLTEDEFEEWLEIRSLTDKHSNLKKMILLDKSLDLYPGKNCKTSEYYNRAEYKYKQLDKFYT